MGVSAQAAGNLLFELRSLLLALPGLRKTVHRTVFCRGSDSLPQNSKKKTTRERWFAFWSW